MSHYKTCLTAGLAPLVLAAPAFAGEASEPEPAVQLHGLVFADAVDGDAPAASDTDFRLAEFRLSADAGPVTVMAGYDFARDGQWRDVGVLGRFGGATLAAGQFKEPASLGKYSPQGGTVMLEAPRFTSAFGMGRRLGVFARYEGEGFVLQGALTEGSLEGTDLAGRGPGQTALNLRGAAHWESEDAVIHAGAYARWLDYDGSGVKLAGSPHSALAGKTFTHALTPYYGREAERSTLAGMEFAAAAGRWFVAAEAARLELDLPGGSEAAVGASLQASVALTGESRRYYSGKGVFKPIKPAAALGEGGFGAVELTARVDRLDFSGFQAGESTAVAAGVTWTPRENVRVIANYAEAFGSGGAPDSRTFGLRFQLGF